MPRVAVRKHGVVFALFFLGAGLSAAALFLYAFVMEPNWIVVQKVKIRDAALAEILGKTRVVQITDIHLTRGLGFREKQLIRKVRALKTDLLLVTGDIFDDMTQLEAAKEMFRQWQDSLIFAVPGNTDHLVMSGSSLARELGSAGVDVLLNEARLVRLSNGNRFWIAGVDTEGDFVNALAAALSRVPAGKPLLMLAHDPDILPKAAEFGVPLVLAGDTHGGQVGIPFLIKMSDYANRTPYLSGLFRRGRTQMYVSRGIGTKTLPVRFLAPPEITVVEVTA